jgi:hypothetical protein
MKMPHTKENIAGIIWRFLSSVKEKIRIPGAHGGRRSTPG